MTAKKVIRAQNIAIENHIPTIYLVDSAGVFLPLQEDVFPDTDDFGRVFRNNAVMSAMGIPQIAAIMGMCVAGGAYLPVMCDTILDDRRQRALPGRAGAGAGGHRARVFGGRTGRRADARADQPAPSTIASPTTISAWSASAPSSRSWGISRQRRSTAVKAEPPAYAAEEIYGIFEADRHAPV